MIEVKNVKLNQYNISINISNNETIGIFGKNQELVKRLLLIIAGINYSTECKFNNNLLYDDIIYFNNRIYIDCEEINFKTLRVNDISKNIKFNYNKIIDERIIANNFKKLNIRQECTINEGYSFTKTGNTLLNLSVILASKQIHIIFNPLYEIKNQNQINALKVLLNNSTNIIGLDGLKKWQIIKESKFNCFNKIYLLSDRFEVIEVNPETDKFYVFDDNIYNFGVNIIFSNNDKVIVRNLSTEQFKQCNKLKMKYIEVDVFEMEDYI